MKWEQNKDFFPNYSFNRTSTEKFFIDMWARVIEVYRYLLISRKIYGIEVTAGLLSRLCYWVNIGSKRMKS